VDGAHLLKLECRLSNLHFSIPLLNQSLFFSLQLFKSNESDKVQLFIFLKILTSAANNTFCFIFQSSNSSTTFVILSASHSLSLGSLLNSLERADFAKNDDNKFYKPGATQIFKMNNWDWKFSSILKIHD